MRTKSGFDAENAACTVRSPCGPRFGGENTLVFSNPFARAPFLALFSRPTPRRPDYAQARLHHRAANRKGPGLPGPHLKGRARPAPTRMMVCTLSLILIPYSKVVPYGIPLADERTTREAEVRQLALGMTKPKATEIESPPHNCPANPMTS